jgi:uncharacterized membrane protein YgcG
MRVCFAFVLGLFLFTTSLFADTLVLTSGREVDCVVIRESKDVVTVRHGYGVMDYPRSLIKELRRTPAVATQAKPTTQPGPAAGPRVPAWSTIVDQLGRSAWASTVRQIPATVIDVGVMRAVPYQSYQCGDDYEINIYGDPDAPVAIEIGIYRSLLTSDEAKAHCVELIAASLGDSVDASILRVLNRQKDLITRDGLTIEITPPDSPDAYGGWWVSIYQEEKLDASRASEAELAQITVARPTPRPAGSSAPRTATRPPAASLAGDEMPDWSDEDLARARDRSSSASSSGSSTSGARNSGSSGGSSTNNRSASSGGGRVYVRGYYRKDGTYVRPHSRRR